MTMKFVSRFWTVGAVVYFAALAFLWWRGYNAQTFAQASFFNKCMGWVAAFGLLWFAVSGRFKARGK